MSRRRKRRSTAKKTSRLPEEEMWNSEQEDDLEEDSQEPADALEIPETMHILQNRSRLQAFRKDTKTMFPAHRMFQTS